MIDKNYYIEKDKKSKNIDKLLLKVVRGEINISELERAIEEYKKFCNSYLDK